MDHSDVIEFFLENRPQLVNQANAVSDVIIAAFLFLLHYVVVLFRNQVLVFF
jgi:hypothetical protein